MHNVRLYKEIDAATYLGLAPKTLSRWRWAGRGPSYTSLGSAIRYSIQDLDAFIANGRVEQ
jgi:hypothetical protein